MDEKQADSVNYLQKKQEIMDNAVPVTAKKLQSSRLAWDYLAVRIR